MAIPFGSSEARRNALVSQRQCRVFAAADEPILTKAKRWRKSQKLLNACFRAGVVEKERHRPEPFANKQGAVNHRSDGDIRTASVEGEMDCGVRGGGAERRRRAEWISRALRPNSGEGVISLHVHVATRRAAVIQYRLQYWLVL